MPPAVIAAAVGAGGSLLSGVLGAHRQNTAQKQQADAYNKYLADTKAGQAKYMDYFNAAPNPTSSTTGSSNSNSSTNYSNTSDPHVTDEYKGMVDAVKGIIQSRLNTPGGLPQGYEANGVRAINSTHAGTQQAAANRAAQFGMTGPQAGASFAPDDTARAGEIANFRGSLGDKARQYQDQDLGMAQGLAEAFGKGTTSTGSSNTRTSGTSSSTTTGSKGLLPENLFMPPAPNATGAPDPTGNLVQGGLSATPQIVNLLGTILGRKAANGNTGVAGGIPTPDDWSAWTHS